jgi:nucleoside-diphosphate-sugar epimerase
MKILVTGHSGYIGSVLTPLLINAGHEVVGIDSELFQECTFGQDDGADVRCLNIDIRELGPVHLRGFDAVVHLAGVCNDPMGDLLPETTHEINHAATVRLAELAKKAGVKRFVFSSTCSVYGASSQDWVDENAPPNPVTPYGVSKYRAERGLVALASDNFSPVLLRSATAFGFSPRIRFDLVLNNLVAHAFTTGHVFLKSDGLAWRPIVHIEDISRAFLAALEAPQEVVHNEVFNVGVTTENYRIREIADIVKKVVAGSEITYSEGAGADKRSYRVDCSKIAMRLPNFRPQWTAWAGAKELRDKYTEFGLALNDFEGERYQRLAYLKSVIGRGFLDKSLRWLPLAQAWRTAAVRRQNGAALVNGA